MGEEVLLRQADENRLFLISTHELSDMESLFDHFIMLEGVDGNAGIVSVNEDPMYEEIKEYVIQAQKASTSLLQRRFGIGYNRGARIIDALEADGIIGPAQGSKPREVYIKPE